MKYLLHSLIVIPMPFIGFSLIQPTGEIVDNEDQDIFACVVERYSVEKEITIGVIEDGDMKTQNILTAEGLMALETIRLQEMHQDDSNATTLLVLDRVERRMQLARNERRKQMSITSFL